MGLVDIVGQVIAAAVVLALVRLLIKSRSLFSNRKYSLRVFGTVLFRQTLYQQIQPTSGNRKWLSHFLVMWGFVLLTVSTTLDYVYNPRGLPLPPLHIVRITGNLGGLFFMVGLIVIVYNIMKTEAIRGQKIGADYLFLGLLIAAGVTGFVAEGTSELNAFEATYYLYVGHLLIVAALLLTAPFTRFIHAIGIPIMRLLESSPQRNATSASGDTQLTHHDDIQYQSRPDWGLERCITCYMCLAACPVYKDHPNQFLGPVGFVKLGNMYYNPIDKADRVLIATKNGIELCEFNGYCQEVCPQHIQIVPLLRSFQNKAAEQKFADKENRAADTINHLKKGL